MTITRQANQVKDLFKFVKKQPNVNPKRIGIVAQPFGVPSFILALPLPVRSAVFISGVVYPFKTISSLFIKAGGFNPKGISRRTRSRGEIIKIKPQFWRSLKQHQDITTRIKSHQGSLLILHGSEDNKVPVKDAQHLFENAQKDRYPLKCTQCLYN